MNRKAGFEQKEEKNQEKKNAYKLKLFVNQSKRKTEEAYGECEKCA